MALGETLKKARLARNESCSDVASATHMKVQVVEALEAEDFAKIAAPIYVKGFIKLYAEHLGLDPAPLISEYVSIVTPKPAPLRPDIPMRTVKTEEATAVPFNLEESGESDLFAKPNNSEEKKNADEFISGQGTSPNKLLKKIAAYLFDLGFLIRKKLSLPVRWFSLDIEWTPSKIAACALAIIFFAVLAISFVIKLATSSETRPNKEISNSGENLIIAVEPPEPFVD